MLLLFYAYDSYDMKWIKLIEQICQTIIECWSVCSKQIYICHFKIQIDVENLNILNFEYSNYEQTNEWTIEKKNKLTKENIFHL